MRTPGLQCHKYYYFIRLARMKMQCMNCLGTHAVDPSDERTRKCPNCGNQLWCSVEEESTPAKIVGFIAGPICILLVLAAGAAIMIVINYALSKIGLGFGFNPDGN